MAEAALMDAQTTTFVPPQSVTEPKGKPGPKPGYKPFNNEVTPEDFFVLLNEIDDADWPKSLCYVWRRDPFTDNTNGGREPKYVDVINRAVSEKDIKEEHGSGTYKLQLNTNDKYVAHTILSLEDPKYPPHVPPGDWFNNPRNKKWATWKPLVEKWWKDKLALLAGPVPTAASDSPALGELTRLISQLVNNNGKTSDSDKPLVAWALQQIADEKKAGREANSPGKLAELLKVMRELNPPPAPPPPPDNTLMTFVLAQLTRVQESNDKLMGLLLTQKAVESKTPDPLAQVETMGKLITLVSGIVQPAQSKEWYQDLAETVAPKLVDLGTQLVAMQNRPQPAPRLQAAPVPQPQASYQNPPPPQPPQVAVTAPPDPQPNPGEPEMDTMQRTILITIANMAAQALNLGVAGDEFAEKICYKFGGAAYDSFLAQVPQDKLLPLFQSVPECWAVLQPFEGALPEFIEMFYAFAQEEEEDGAKSISVPAEVVATVKPAKKKAKA